MNYELVFELLAGNLGMRVRFSTKPRLKIFVKIFQDRTLSLKQEQIYVKSIQQQQCENKNTFMRARAALNKRRKKYASKK